MKLFQNFSIEEQLIKTLDRKKRNIIRLESLGLIILVYLPLLIIFIQLFSIKPDYMFLISAGICFWSFVCFSLEKILQTLILKLEFNLPKKTFRTTRIVYLLFYLSLMTLAYIVVFIILGVRFVW